MNTTQSAAVWSTRDAWRRLRLEAKAAEHYYLPYSMYLGQTHRDVLLDRLLPALLQIKATSILDDALAGWLSDNGHTLGAQYRSDLNGRLCYCADHGLLPNPEPLQEVRRRRNQLAHEPEAACTWAQLAEDLNTLEEAMVHLQLARITGELQYFSERSALEGSSQPGVEFERTFKYGIKENDRVALEISWNQHILKEQ